MKNINFIIKSIVVLLGITMLLSCENNIKEVEKLTSQSKQPEQSGENVEFIHTDSTRVTYRAFAIEFIEMNTDEGKYNEFPKGGKITLYNDDESEAGQIKANYAKNMVSEELWELRNDVEAITDDGKTINTELMYWDQKKKLIYSDQYVRITTTDNQVIEGNSFTSDEKMNKIVLKKVSGEVFLEDKAVQ